MLLASLNISNKTTANYRYDQNNRLEEIRSDIYKETHGRLYHYQENRDGSGVILEITYVGKSRKTEFSRRLHQKSLRQRWQTYL